MPLQLLCISSLYCCVYPVAAAQRKLYLLNLQAAAPSIYLIQGFLVNQTVVCFSAHVCLFFLPLLFKKAQMKVADTHNEHCDTNSSVSLKSVCPKILFKVFVMHI